MSGGKWLRAGDWNKCSEHDMVFPRGAFCPACGPPPEPITLEDIDERLVQIENLLKEKDNGNRNKFRRSLKRKS